MNIFNSEYIAKTSIFGSVCFSLVDSISSFDIGIALHDRLKKDLHGNEMVVLSTLYPKMSSPFVCRAREN